MRTNIQSKQHYLYILRDPFDRKIKYVGITTNLIDRGKQHFRRTKEYMHNKKFIEWKDYLRMRGTAPLLEVIKTCDNYESARRAEKLLIKSIGKELLNIEFNESFKFYKVAIPNT